jgi:RNA polymerase sigma-70 factor (ECF subfamily)
MTSPAGSAAAAREFEAHRGFLWGLSYRITGSTADADDVVQETFLVLLRGERFDPRRGTLSGYLFGIARHHILKRISAAQRESAIDDEAIEAIAGDEGAALDGMSREEAVHAVRAAVQSLPLVYREIVTLCELEELDYATAASVLQCPIGTVRSRLHRAKALLVAKLTSTVAVRGAPRCTIGTRGAQR